MRLCLRGAAVSGSTACLTFVLEVLSTSFKEDVDERCSRWRMITGSTSQGLGAPGQKGKWTGAGSSDLGLAGNEGRRKGEVVENGHKGSVSTQGRREQVKERRGDVGEGH